jgi:RNA 3'-terminal phosphate cyclase
MNTLCLRASIYIVHSLKKFPFSVVQVERRGFYPKGGGRVRLTAECLPEGGTLPAFETTKRGHVTEVSVRAFTAGSQSRAAAQDMIRAAEVVLQKVISGSQVFGV